MTATEHVILVDENDQQIGIAEKMKAHQDNLCHRAFSVFILHQGKILLQQRAAGKYHSAGLWTNTCCSHPRPDEDIIDAGKRRLQEEMGLSATLQWVGRFHYIAHFENGLSENEIDHVLMGTIEHTVIVLNPLEASAYRWIEPCELNREIAEHPERFTPWLKPALDLLMQ